MKIANYFKQFAVWILTAAALAMLILARSIEEGATPADYELVDDILLPDPSRGLLSGTPWTNGIVPYVFAGNVNQTRRQLMLDTMRVFEYEAAITFVSHTSQANYIFIQNSTDTSLCGSSNVGMIGGFQYLNIRCWTNRVMLHELGHALGLWHEQQRSDREDFVTINFANIPSELWHNFNIVSGNPLAGYDFFSIMHYHQYALAINPNQPTITAKPGYEHYQDLMGALPYLSNNDGYAMASIYGPSDWGQMVSSPPILRFETIVYGTVADQDLLVWKSGNGSIPYYLEPPWMLRITPLEGSASSDPTTHQVNIHQNILNTVGNYVYTLPVVRSLDQSSESSLTVQVRVLPVNLDIPDASFKAYLVAQFDSDQDGEISHVEALAVMAIDCGGLGITDLTGLERFKNLMFLDASDNFITDMQPIWDNPNLTQDPDCSHYIDISENALNTNPGQGYCGLHCLPIGQVNTADQAGSANPIFCRCEEQSCAGSEYSPRLIRVSSEPGPGG